MIFSHLSGTSGKRSVCAWLMATAFAAMPVYADYQSPAFDQGKERMSHRDYDGAIVSFGEAIGLSAENPRAYLLRGQCFYNLKNYSQALDDFSHAIISQPENSEIYLWRGNTYANLTQDENAIADYQKAIKLNPKLAEQYFAAPPEKRNADSQPATAVVGRRKFRAGTELDERGGSYVKQTTQTHAVDLYKQAMTRSYPDGLKTDLVSLAHTKLTPLPLSDDTSKKPATITSSNISLEETTGKEKSKAVKKAKKVDDKFDQVGHDKFKKEVDQYSEAIRQDAGSAANYYHRGRAHQYLKEYEQALQDFSDAIRLSPQDSQFYLARAAIYSLMKKPLMAKADVKNAQSVDPTVPSKVILDLEPPQP